MSLITPYGLGWQRSLPDFRDREFAFKSRYNDLLDLPKEIDWWKRSIAPPVYDQKQTGSCVGMAGARLHHFRQIISGKLDEFQPSAMFLYALTRMMRGGKAALEHDGGCQIRDMLKVLVTEGVCPESMWPFSNDCVRFEPNDSCYEEADRHEALAYRSVDNGNLVEFLSALDVGPLAIGVSVFTSFFDAPNGVIPMPKDSDSFEGGHAITITGADMEGRWAWFDNSWGKGWGQNGRGKIPLDYLLDADLATDCWLLTAIE